MPLVIVQINTPETTGRINNLIALSSDPKGYLTRFQKFINGIVSGALQRTALLYKVANGQAIMLFTFTGAPTAAQTAIVNGVTITARASGATGNEFNIGGSVTASAENFISMFNTRKASVPAWTGWTATNAAGVVTLTCDVAGVVGMSGTLSTSMTNTSVTAAAGGTEAYSSSLSF